MYAHISISSSSSSAAAAAGSHKENFDKLQCRSSVDQERDQCPFFHEIMFFFTFLYCKENERMGIWYRETMLVASFLRLVVETMSQSTKGRISTGASINSCIIG